MAKRLFLLILSSFIGIFGSPEILMASDSYPINCLDETRVVETVLPDEPDVSAEQEFIASQEPIYVEPVYVEPQVYVPANYISIAGNNIDIVGVDDTVVDAGNHVNRYGDRFFYGHNTANVFGNIINLGVGNVFSITQDGVSRDYQIAKIVIYEKNTENGHATRWIWQLYASGS